MHATPEVGRRSPRTLALGAWLATQGVLVTLSLALAVLGAGAGVMAALLVARKGGGGAPQIPIVASLALAWGAGVMLAVGAALHAIRRDKDEGIIALVRMRGGSTGRYVIGRVGGLVVVLAIAVGGATLIVSLAAASAGRAPPREVARASAAALAYSLAFAATLGPVAMAALGATPRIGGYLVFLAVVVVPELTAPWTSAWLPDGWHELTSIPAALDAVRTGVESPLTSAHLARAVAGLAAVVSLCLVAVSVQAARIDREHAR
ncbi:MAG: hypothetical protein M3O50_19260 [Myxococcota bacterium]|nr:hypothetical protein [Myxococcota bacterium]